MFGEVAEGTFSSHLGSFCLLLGSLWVTFGAFEDHSSDFGGQVEGHRFQSKFNIFWIAQGVGDFLGNAPPTTLNFGD